MAKNPNLFLVFLFVINVFHHCKSQSSETNGFKLRLNRIVLQDHNFFPDTIRPVLSQLNYLFTIDAFIGTPRSKKTFIFDIVHSLIWTQCKPCVHCFKQDYPLFDPSESDSFQKLPLNHSLASFFNHSSKDGLKFSNMYRSGQSSSSGFAAVETFTFPPAKIGHEIMKGVVFGCSNNYKGEFMTNNTSVTGIMSMNRSPLSLVGQMGRLSRRFSYCFPLLKSPTKTMFLRFGSDVKVKWNFQKIKFIGKGSTYRIQLLNISIAGQRLNLPRGTFSSEGCLLDVGTKYTQLPWGAYTPVLNAVTQQLARINLTKVTSDPRTDGDLQCYGTKSGMQIKFSMTLHFQGAKLKIDSISLFRRMGDRICLAFIGSNLTVLGAHQQQNVRLVYDVANGKLLFAKEVCADDDK